MSQLVAYRDRRVLTTISCFRAAVASPRRLCASATVDKLREYNNTNEGFLRALKDWPSYSLGRTIIDTLDDETGSQETETGDEVAFSISHVKELFRKAKKALGLKSSWMTQRKKKKRLRDAIKSGLAALDVDVARTKGPDGSDFVMDGAPGNHRDTPCLLDERGIKD